MKTVKKLALESHSLCMVVASLICSINVSASEFLPKYLSPLCTLDENCSVDGDKIVGFGKGDKFYYSTLSGSFLCSAEVFDAPKEAADEDSICVTPNYLFEASSSSSAPTAQPIIQSIFDSEQQFAIVSLSSGKALTMLGEEQSEAVIVQSNFNHSAEQLWRLIALDDGYFAISTSDEDHAIGLQGWSKDEGAELLVTEWINGWHQQWQLQLLDSGAFVFYSRFSQKAIDVYEMNNFDNGSVRAWTYWGGENQQWLLVPIN